MYKTIWKWKLSLAGRQIISVPKVFDILTVQIQRDHLRIWAKVDPEAELRAITILVVGTGKPLPVELQDGNGTYINTALLDDGYLAFHIFMVKEPG